MDNVVTVKQAAEELSLAQTTIRVYIEEGIIQATKFGRQWAIPEAEVERYKRDRRRVGRPKKKEKRTNEAAAPTTTDTPEK